MNETNFRKRLNNTLWLIANKMGMTHDDVRDFAVTVYQDLKGKKKVISSLDAARLETVVRKLKEHTGVDINIPSRPDKKRKKTNLEPGQKYVEYATKEQLALIEMIANSIPISDELLLRQKQKMMKGDPGPFTKIAAQKMIEALKKMEARGFTEKKPAPLNKQKIVFH